MHIQPITSQPNFDGKLIGKGVVLLKDSHWNIPAGLNKYSYIKIPDNLLNKVREMVKEKPYDVFVSPNINNKEFLNIDANYTFDNVKKGIQGKIKVARDAIEALPVAIQEAMDVFENSETNKFLGRNLYACN